MTPKELIEYNNGIICGLVARRGISSTVPFKQSASLPELPVNEQIAFETGMLNGFTPDVDLAINRPFENPQTVEDILEIVVNCKNIVIYGAPSSNVCTAIIDWGDGVVEPNKFSQYHTYETEGLHTIKIQFIDYFHNEFDWDINTWGTTTELVQIKSKLPKALKNITKFYTAYQGWLTSIPAGFFDNCPNITNFRYAFLGCVSLTSIPIGLFDSCPNITTIFNAFGGCTSLTGPAPALWLRTPKIEGGACFRDCTGLSNYEDIPAYWK